MSEVNLLSIKDICARTALHRQRIYERMARGEFPKPVRLGVRTVRWHSDDVDRWIEGLRERAA